MKNWIWYKPLVFFGWFHILGIVIAFIGALLGFYFGKKYSYQKYDRKIDLFLGFFWFIFVAIQLSYDLFLYNVNGIYPWNSFPYQICTMPLFIYPFFFILKKQIMLKKALTGFTGFVLLAAASFYFFYPTTAIRSSYVFVSLNSFAWHIIVIFLAAFIISSYHLYDIKKYYIVLYGYIAWLFLAIGAALGNLIINVFLPWLNVDFFFINYQQKKTFYPILNLLFSTPKPYFLFLVCYFIYFGLGIMFFYFLIIGTYAIIKWLKERKKKNEISNVIS